MPMYTKINLVGLLVVLTVFFPTFAQAQTPDALTIIRKADEKMRGKTAFGEMTMTIVRPKWSREITLKSWSKGTD